MKPWVRVSLILCTFGFMKELRPTEPFVTDYIIEFKNVTAEEVIHVAFPISTYTSLGTLLVILLITDLLRYKPIVCLEGICHVLAWGILTLFSGLTSVIIVEVFYGLACSAEVAYSTYIYAQVDKDFYKKVTSQASSARLAGKFFGGIVAQLLITTNLMNYHELNYVTLTCVSVGALCTFFLPTVKENKFIIQSSPTKTKKLLLPTKIASNESCDASKTFSVNKSKKIFTVKTALQALTEDFRIAYGNSYVLKWSLWWAIASAGQYQVLNYIQALWDKIKDEGGNEAVLYNGAVKASHTFLSTLLSLGVGYTNIKWEKWGEWTLTLISVIQGLMLIWMATTSSLYLAYLSYIIFRTIHPVMITVASAEVAQRIPQHSYGLIFGMNMFIALCLQTVLTIVVSDMKGLALDERSQYVVYGACFIQLGILIGGTALCSTCLDQDSDTKSCEKKLDGRKDSAINNLDKQSVEGLQRNEADEETEKTDFIKNNVYSSIIEDEANVINKANE